MSLKSRIEKGLWWDRNWGIIEGCTKVSAGCANCFAERYVKRFHGEHEHLKGLIKDGHWTGQVNLRPELLGMPLRVEKPTTWFVGERSDLFHEAVPTEFIYAVLGVILASSQHTFMVPTKRPARIIEVLEAAEKDCKGRYIAPALIEHAACTVQKKAGSKAADALFKAANRFAGGGKPIGQNLLFGASVENQDTADERIPHLIKVTGKYPWIKLFISYEPALGPVDFTNITVPLSEVEERHEFAQRWREDFKFNSLVRVSDDHYYSANESIDWIIMGGESGPGARPPHPDWVRSVRDQCAVADVPFFFKQWGEWSPGGRDERHSVILRADGRQESLTFANDIGSLPNDDREIMTRVGKARAGCLLDGKEYKETPTF